MENEKKKINDNTKIKNNVTEKIADVLKPKSQKDLFVQFDCFLDYAEKEKLIDNESHTKIKELIKNEELDLTDKKLVKEKLKIILSPNVLTDLEIKYINWLKINRKDLNYISSRILPVEYKFLAKKNYFKKYFSNSEISDSYLEHWKVKILKNISIFKKYNIDWKDLGLFIKPIIKNLYADILEWNLKALNDNWIKDPKDIYKFRKVFDTRSDRTDDMFKYFKSKWISSIDDFIKLIDFIVGTKDSESVIWDLEILYKAWISNIDDLVKLKSIILSNHYVIRFNSPLSSRRFQKLESSKRLQLLTEKWINKADDLLDLKRIILDWHTESLSFILNSWINSVEDLLKYKDLISSWYFLQKANMLSECWITKLDDILKFNSILRYNSIDSVKSKIIALKECWISSVDDLIKCEDLFDSYRKSDSIKTNILILKGHWITAIDDLLKLKKIILSYNPSNGIESKIKILNECWVSSVDDLIKFQDFITEYTFNEPEVLKSKILLLEEYGIIWADNILKFIWIIDSRLELNELKEDLNALNKIWVTEPLDILEFEQPIIRHFLMNNISSYHNYFWEFKYGELWDNEKKILTKICLSNDLKFKETNHKWYIKYIWEIINSGYDIIQKSEMIKIIVSKSFDKAESYLKIFKILDNSISMDIQRIKNELIDEISWSEDPEFTAKKILDIFEKNNLPLTWKIFKVFEMLYPNKKIKDKLHPSSWSSTLWSPVLNDYIKKWKDVYPLIYKDLMNISIKSWDRSLKKYISTFVWSEKLLKNFETIVNDENFDSSNINCLSWKLDEKEKEMLLYLFRKIAVLYNVYYWEEILEEDWIENINLWESRISDKKLISFYFNLKEWLHLKKETSIYDRIEKFLYWLRYRSFGEVLSKMKESKMEAHTRWLKLYNESKGWVIEFPKHAFIKGVKEDAFHKIINRWITSREYLWWWEDWKNSWTEWWTWAWDDCTPFDIDWLYVDSYLHRSTYWRVLLVSNTGRWTIVETTDNKIDWLDGNKYELFKTGSENHYWIRTGIPMTEVDYIIYYWRFDSIEFQNICYEIARNWYYIPVTDESWNIIFKPEMYHRIRLWFNYMDYYDWFDVQLNEWKYVLKESDNVVHKTDDVELLKLISENSPSNGKYQEVGRENWEIAKNTLQRIKKILEDKCWIKFNSEFDTSITWAQLYDSWSTWRWTDVPTKDVDLDFTLLLDAKDYEWINEIKKIIHESIWTKREKDHDTNEKNEEWNQMKSEINNISKSDERPNGVPLDLLILKKSQVIDYSSSDAMKEKLSFILKDSENWRDDLDWVRTNVIIMKKLLKAKWCYKKTEWWISWIWIENWITQNHWNFIEALESFETVAYKWKYQPWKMPLALEEFKNQYPIYDAWENYKDWCNDNFVYKLNWNWYQWILQIIQTYRKEWIEWIRKIIREYEEKKSQYIE